MWKIADLVQKCDKNSVFEATDASFFFTIVVGTGAPPPVAVEITGDQQKSFV